MTLKQILTPKQIEVCQKEKYYFQQIGIKKSLLQIAFEHNFVRKKEHILPYNMDLIKKFEIIVTDENENELFIERKEFLGDKRVAELEKQLSKKIIQKTIPVREFEEKFRKFLSVDPDLIEKSIKKFNADETDDVEILNLFTMILMHGARHRVSDIHINCYKDFSWLRYRQNGKVQAKHVLNHELAQRFTLIIKEKSNIDLINVKTPQSGSFSEIFQENLIDFRVEIAPSQFGENVVIRILDSVNSVKTLDEIFPIEHPMTEHICYLINQKDGFFLTVGPTGSGKTTTLNAIINQRDRLHEIIYTLEDPIEYKIDFVTQYEINDEIGFTFATAMKSVMRQDPDVIVIGEMRDKESIQIALKASHSGHMVFSTLHTTNSYMALERIRDEGGDLFILAYSLSGVVAQRLVPKLCECKIPAKSDKGKKFFKTSLQGCEKKGCIKCNFTGYSGRVLLTDIVFIPKDVKTRYSFYLALKKSTVMQVWDKLITFSYYQSAQYIYENGLSDYEILSTELLSLGYINEN